MEEHKSLQVREEEAARRGGGKGLVGHKLVRENARSAVWPEA